MEGANNLNSYKNIKSITILKRIFENISQKTFLKLIKCNKKIQEALNIGINNYITYYYKIELEIIPIYKKEENIFINYDENKKSFYHIYFNNENIEKNRNYFTKNDNVAKIKIIIDKEIKTFGGLFEKSDCIEKISFSKFKRNDINDMKMMFSNCSSLKELNFNDFKTDNVTNMNKMFYNCSLLERLSLNNLNTSNVTDMSYMFYGCSSLKKINLDNINTNNVKNMNSMFYGCSSLKVLNLNNFVTNNVTDMSFMFHGCISLKELSLKNFNTINVINMSKMFCNCSSLKKLDLYHFNIKNVKNVSGMFYKCSNELKFKIRNQITNLKKEAFEEFSYFQGKK